MDPLTNGDYPRSMRSLVGNRLPKFSKKQSNIVNGSFDFIGLNYRTTTYAANAPHHNAVNASYTTDMRVNLLSICYKLNALVFYDCHIIKEG
jgi:beta-glucosidase